LNRLQNKIQGVRAASSALQFQKQQGRPAIYLFIGLLLGGAATISTPKLPLISNAIIDTPPRWSGITREPLLQSKYADEKTMLKVSRISSDSSAKGRN
jgi:D-lactate dehydrogenase (cytochrome)